MLLRIASIAIVLFWAIMTFLHVKDVYFPDTANITAPAPRIVLERFLNQEDKVQPLKLFLQGEHIGDAALSWEKAKDGLRKIQLQGGARVPIPGIGLQEKIGFRGTMFLSNVDEVVSFNLAMRASSQDLAFKASSEVDADGNPTPPTYQLTQGDTVLIDSQSADGGLPPTLAWLKPMILGEIEKRKKLGQINFDDANSSTASPTTPANQTSGLRSRAETEVLSGRSRPVHVLEPDIDGAPPIFQLVFTEGGELVKVATAGNFEMHSLLLTLQSE